MADRSVSWRADANFSRVSREANRTRRDLEALRREQERMAATSTATSATSTTANNREGQSATTLAGRLQGLSRARRQSADEAVSAARAQQSALDRVRASRDADTASQARSTSQTQAASAVQQRANAAQIQSFGQLYQARARDRAEQERSNQASQQAAASHDQEAASGNRLMNVLRSMQQIRREGSAAAAAERAASQDVAAARDRETVASQRVTDASLRLEAARMRVQAADQRAQQTASALARAQEEVARAGTDNERATSRLARAQGDSESAARRLAQAHNSVARAESDVSRMSGAAETATRRVENAMRTLESSGNNNRSMFDRLANSSDNAGNIFKKVGSAVGGMALKFGAMGALIVPIISLVGQLAGGLYAVGSAAAPAIGVLAGLPGVLLGAGTAIGTLVAGFSGIGTALKAYGKQQAQSGAQAAAAADQAKAAAERVKEAKQGVVDAQAGAAKSARDSAQQVKDAEEAAKTSVQEANARIVEAIQQAAQQRKQANDQVVKAKEQGARSIEQADQQVIQSERSLAAAQGDVKAAQLGLNDARRTAIQQLEDMQKAARDASFSEEEASLALIEAGNRLAQVKADPTSGDLAIAQADLNYREAQARLSDARENKVKATKDNADAQKKGVEGSDVVVAAQQRIVDSLQKLADAQSNLVGSQKAAARAQIDAAKTIQAAEENRNRTIQQGEKSIADARKSRDKAAISGAKSVAQAKQSQADQQVSSAKSIRSAEDTLTKAIQAQRSELLKGNSAANEYAAAMAKLSPAGREFVRYLTSLKPKLTDLKAAAAEGLLPGVERGMKSMMGLFPMVKKTVGNMAKIMGDGAAKLGKTLSDTESQGIWSRLFKTNEDAAKNYTSALSPLAKSMLRIMDAARPLTLWISQLALDFANYMDKTTKTNTENGKMAAFFEKSKKVAAQLGRIIRNLGGIFYNVGKAGSGTGQDLLDIFEKWTKKMDKFTGSVEGQNKIKKWFEDIKPGIVEAARLVGKLSKLFAGMADNKDMAPLLKSIERIVDMMNGKGISEAMSKSLTSIANSIGDILQNGGGGVLSAMVDTIARMFDVFATITSISGVPQILTAIAVALGAIKAVKLIGAITGISGLVRSTRNFTQGARNPSPAADGTVQGSTAGRIAGRVGRRVNRTSAVQGARSRAATTRSRVGSRLSAARTRITRRGGGGGSVDPTSSIVSGTNTALGRSRGQATTAGENVSTGFANGMRDRLSSVRNAATSVAESVIARFRSIFRMHSPSVVMSDLGVNTIQGFINGMRERLGGVRTMAREVGSTVTGALRGIPGEAEAAGEATATAAAGGGATGGTRRQRRQQRRQTRGGRVRGPGVSGGMGRAMGAVGGVGAAAGALSMLPGPLGDVAGKLMMVMMLVEGMMALFAAFSTPVLIIIGVIAALGIGFYLLFKKNKAFHDFVMKAWGALKNLAISVWQNGILPALKAVSNFMTTKVGPAFVWLWQTVIKPTFSAIGSFIAWTWKNVISPALSAVVWFFKNVLYPVIKWLYENVIKNYFNLIGTIIKFAWNNVIKPVFDAIKSFVSGPLTTAFKNLKSFIGTVWDGIKGAISTAWNRGIKPAFDAIKSGIGKVGDAFGSAKKAISTAWDAVKGIVKKPIHFVLDTVLNKGLIKGFNWISDKVSGPHIDPITIPQGLATGGRVNGNSPTSKADNVPAMLTAGEWVQPVAAVKHYGADFMEAIRTRRLKLAAGGGVEGAENGVVRLNKRRKKKGMSFLRDGGMAGDYSLGSMGGAATLSNYYNEDATGHEQATGSGAKLRDGTGTGASVPFRPQMHAALIRYGKLLQSRGMAVLENPAFGAVHPVHMAGSLHYNGEAIDVSGGPGWPKTGYSVFNEALRRGFAAIWQSKGHYDHVHIDTGIWKEYQNKTSMIGGNIEATASDSGNWLTNAFGSLKDLLGNINPVTKLKGFFTGALDKLQGNTLGSLLKSVVMSPVNAAVSKLKSAFFGSGKSDNVPATVSASTAKGKQMAAAMGWKGGNWSALYKLWQGESNWNPHAENASSGAYGIPQALPGSKMASAGRDWKTNPATQIKWGLRYIKERYGTPLAALGAWQSRKPHWYAEGGHVAGHGNVDSVKAMLMPGEFVMRREAARRIGYGTLNQMNNIDRPGRSTAFANGGQVHGGVQHFATGGQVAPKDGTPINSMLKPGGNRMLGWKLIHQLLGLKTTRGMQLPYPDRWDSSITSAFAKKNYTMPDMSTITSARSVGGFLKPLTSWLQSTQSRLPGKTQMERYPFLSPANAKSHPALTRLVQKIIGVKQDSVYGHTTGKAVVAWKKAHNIGSANNINHYTWKQLAEQYAPDSYAGRNPHTNGRWPGVRLEDVANRYGMSMWQAAPLGQGANMDYIKRHVLAASSKWFLNDASQMSGSTSWLNGGMLKSVQSMFGMAKTGTWTTTMADSLTYAMRKALKKPTATIFPPWWTLDPAQQAIEVQDKSNKDQSEFLKDLDLLSGWGLNFLVDKLQNQGVEEGLPVARASVKSRPLAEQYNSQLEAADKLNKTGSEDYTKFVSTLQAPGAQRGIRTMAQALGLADYAVVQMFKDLVKTGRMKEGGERTALLEKEIRMFDKGLFYFAHGGRVPGAGSGDTVPAMLTPGEFVLRRSAVQALGLKNLEDLNAQKFASGGMVYSMAGQSSSIHDTLVRPPFSWAPNQRLHDLTGGRHTGPTQNPVTQEFNTNIYNPVREKSTRSFNAMLRQRGQFGGATIIGDVTNVRGD